MLSEGGGVDSECGGVSSDVGGANSVGVGVSGKGSWVPLDVRGGFGSCERVDSVGGQGTNTDSTRRGVELEMRLSLRDSEDFSIKRHCIMLVSFPPVEIR